MKRNSGREGEDGGTDIYPQKKMEREGRGRGKGREGKRAGRQRD